MRKPGEALPFTLTVRVDVAACLKVAKTRVELMDSESRLLKGDKFGEFMGWPFQHVSLLVGLFSRRVGLKCRTMGNTCFGIWNDTYWYFLVCDVFFQNRVLAGFGLRDKRMCKSHRARA
jgi:hypothetical protein